MKKMTDELEGLIANSNDENTIDYLKYYAAEFRSITDVAKPQKLKEMIKGADDNFAWLRTKYMRERSAPYYVGYIAGMIDKSKDETRRIMLLLETKNTIKAFDEKNTKYAHNILISLKNNSSMSIDELVENCSCNSAEEIIPVLDKLVECGAIVMASLLIRTQRWALTKNGENYVELFLL